MKAVKPHEPVGSTYPYGPHVLLFCCLCLSTEFLVKPMQEVVEAFWCRDDVERGRAGASLFKEANPKLASGKFPFSIRPFL